jgi:hypothetical protein
MSEAKQCGGNVVAAVKGSAGNEEVLYCLRKRKNGQFAVMAYLGEAQIVLFDERRHALRFRRKVIGQHCISSKEQLRLRRDWQVSEFQTEVNNKYRLAYLEDDGFHYLGLIVSEVETDAA